MGRRVLLLIAGVLAFIGVAIVVVLRTAGPTTLRIAVAERGEDFKLVESFRAVMEREHADIRLKIVPASTLKASAEAIENGDADLALVRSDVALPPNAQTVAIMHEDMAIILAPEPTGITQIADLAGKRLGLVVRHRADIRLIEQIITHYGLARAEVAVKLLAPDAVLKEITDKTVDAVAMVGPPTEPEIASLVNAIDQVTDGTVVVVPVPQAEALVQKSPVLESTHIVAGTFGGRPPRPLEDVKTVAVTYRLVASTGLDVSVVADLTRTIFELRPRIARAVPLANLIDAPDTSKSAALPVHPGAANYLDDNEETFFERYGDWIYILMAVLGFGGSAVAAIASRFSQKKDERADHLLGRLLSILKDARHAGDTEELDLLSLEVDVIVAETVNYARRDGGNQHAVHAMSLAIDGARAAIGEQRASLHRAAQERGAESPSVAEPRLTAIEGRAARK